MSDPLIEQELEMQAEQRARRVGDFNRLYERLGEPLQEARSMHLTARPLPAGGLDLQQVVGPVLTSRAAPRDKRIRYEKALLPKIDSAKQYAASDIVTATMKAFAREHCSTCVIRVAPGDKVRPAHSHPHSEEVIYILSGSGRVLVDGDVAPVRAGSVVLFPQGKPHMLQNTSGEEMKVVCFFAPATTLDNYRMHEEIDFPD
jgi:mannose-6-phosphate isomerase-like protein (cupin superfamily)